MKNVSLMLLAFFVLGFVSCKAQKKSTPNYGLQQKSENRSA